jgi:hypothetical protein
MEMVSRELRNSRKLTELSVVLKGCSKITDATIKGLMDGIRSHRALQKLTIWLEGCENIKDPGMRELIPGIANYKELINLTLLLRFPASLSLHNTWTVDK